MPRAVTVTAGETFDQWTVIETGLRTAPDGQHRLGRRAARCECSCKKTTRVIVVTDLTNGVTHSCGKNHRKDTHEPFTPEPPSPALTAQRAERARRITELHGWITRNAPDRLVHAAEAAAAIDVSAESARSYLHALRDAGQLQRPWPGAYALPGAGPFENPHAGWGARDRTILAFLAAEGGGTWAEITAGTAIPGNQVHPYLARLIADGRVERVPDGHDRRYYYLLPGQFPGEPAELPAAGSDLAEAS